MAKKKLPVCSFIPELSPDLQVAAAFAAIAIFPANAPFQEVNPARIGVLTQKYWGERAKDLTVGFMEQTGVPMRDKVLSYANRWSDFSSVKFRWTQTNPTIRVSFGRGGYYSYLGTDCLSIPANQNTMNLEAFTVRTPDSEWERVVVHEFGHALGCPHEQQRKEILNLIDERKVIAEFRRTQGWDEQTVREQILTPLEERSLMAGSSPHADQVSVMCYQFSGKVTKSGQPILGGATISAIDREYFAKIYLKDDAPPPPPVSGLPAVLIAQDDKGNELARYKRV